MPDIEDRDDCERLVRAFYARAMTDPMIGFIFTDVARLDLEAHVPTITSFWETLLLGRATYGGGAFGPHVRLHAKVELKKGHFDRWVALWRQTVDELYTGPRAQHAKRHGARVARAFHDRLHGIEAQDPGAPFAGLTIAVSHPAGDTAS